MDPRLSALTFADLNHFPQLSKEHSRNSTFNLYSSGMEGRLIQLVTALMFFVTPGTAFLSFANDTQMNITLAGCGVTKLCVELPHNCDPAGNQSCLFTSVAASTPVTSNGTTLSINLKGQSSGYIALGLALNASEATTMAFICGQNSSANGTFFFRTMQINNTNGVLTPKDMTVTDIQGLVKDNVIQCGFSVPSMSATFSILLGNGTVDSNLGPFISILNSGPLNVINSGNISITTAVAQTTVAQTTVAQTTVAQTTLAKTTTAKTTTAKTTTAKTTTAKTTTAKTTTAKTTVAKTTTAKTTVGKTTAMNTSVVMTAVPASTAPTTTVTAMTTGTSGTLHPHAFLLLLSVLTLHVLQKA